MNLFIFRMKLHSLRNEKALKIIYSCSRKKNNNNNNVQAISGEITVSCTILIRSLSIWQSCDVM